MLLRRANMSTMLARIGRDRQRYENNLRLVSGCIPYRFAKGNDSETDNLESRIEVLMISSPNRDDLVFPKGGWEDDETLEEAACREALEEAGVRGKLNEKPLGVWEFRSKSRQDMCSLEGGCKGYMFALEVTEELETWPERENHDRRWLSVKEAFELCRYEWMRRALENFLNTFEENWKQKFEATEELIESPPPTVSDCQIITPNLCIDHPNSSQRHGMTFSWLVPIRAYRCLE